MRQHGLSLVCLLGSDASGENVFFTTADALVPGDTNTQRDYYDARVDGGFPAAVIAPGCEGEGCHGAPAVPPVFGAPASETFSGPGNLAPAAVVKAKAKPLTRVQKLAKALKACHRKKPKKRRSSCERQARKKYGAKKPSKKKGHR